MLTIGVLSGGMLMTVQDTRSRQRWAHLGVPPGGAMDTPAAADANWLVGNPPHSALLEITTVGPSLRFPAPALIAICGADLSFTVNGRPFPLDCAIRLPAGSVLDSGERRRGLRAYLAIGGGIDVPEILGSRSTDLRSGFGGLAGRALRTGDLLNVGTAVSYEGRTIERRPARTGPIRVLPGLHAARSPLCAATWQVGAADRQGMRLVGTPIPGGAADLPSFGVVPGAIQLPPDGQPIILLAEAQPTGGYPIIGVVPSADLPRLAQCTTGDTLSFQPVSYRALEEAPKPITRYLDDLATVRWAGA